MRSCSGTWKPVSPGSGWMWSFIALFVVWTNTEGEVSPWCEQTFLGKEKAHFSP
jgi:hypothetical protein